MQNVRRLFVRDVIVALAISACAGCASEIASSGGPPAPMAQTHRTGALYVFTFRPGPAWQVGVPMNGQRLGPHAAYWRQLVAEGRAFVAGGFVESAGGMAIVVASSANEAEAIRAGDPAIQSGVFAATVEQWRPSYRTEAPLPHAPSVVHRQH